MLQSTQIEDNRHGHTDDGPFAVQECAQWMMQMPDANGNPTRVKFPPFYKNGEMAEHTAYVHDDDYTFLWKPEWFAKTVYIDAFTVEPEKVISQRKGLWEYGKAKPIVESLIANAAPGSLPHVQVRSELRSRCVAA